MPGAERVLDFSEGPARISMRNEQLVIEREGFPVVTTPLAETAVAVLSSRRLVCTLPALDGLMRHGGAVVVCGEDMRPTGLMLPLAGHTTQTRRMLAQARAPAPVRKRLWQQIVRAKVLAQAAALEDVRGDDAGLRALAAEVRSGDPTNVEAQAARRYWPLLFADDMFRRRREAPDQNRLLNYGYAVLRGGAGRAVCAAGLHPSIGVHHHGRSNAFCLADDLMEPYRPLVDAEVARIAGELGPDAPLDRAVKESLVGVLHGRLEHEGERRTVFEWLGRSASSLGRCLEREERRVFFPAGLVT